MGIAVALLTSRDRVEFWQNSDLHESFMHNYIYNWQNIEVYQNFLLNIKINDLIGYVTIF